MNIMNNQIPNSGKMPRQKTIEYVDDFPGNNNRRINMIFETRSGLINNIATPVNIKVKDLFLTYAKKVGISPNILGNKIYFLYNGHKLNINEEKDLISFGFDLGTNYKIIVVDKDDLMGGNSNFYFKLKSKI